MLANGACHFLWLIRVRLWNCANIQVPLMVAQIRLLFADILRKKIDLWALPNSKISILSASFALSLFLCHFDYVKTSSPTVARSIWTVMCMFAGRKVDGCQQSLIVISGTSPGSHSSASMYIIFLWRQLCWEVPAWSIAEFYNLLLSVSSFHL